MENINFESYSLEEKRAFLTGFLKNFIGKSEELTTFYNYFSSSNYISEEECDELFISLKNNF